MQLDPWHRNRAAPSRVRNLHLKSAILEETDRKSILMQAVILAGGLGTRMRPFTEKAPKCLLPVQGRPFIDYQLDLLKAGGVREIVLCLGYLGEMVESYLGDGANRGMQHPILVGFS